MKTEYIEGCSEVRSCEYKGNDDISVVIIGEGVKAIGKEAFENCCNLRMVVLPESINTISESAFSNSGIKIKKNLCPVLLMYCVENSAADTLLGENHIKIYYKNEKRLNIDNQN